MPSPSFFVQTDIRAQPAVAFAYVADLSRHGEWAANDLRVEPVDDLPIATGKKYRSFARARGSEFSTPNVFAGSDEMGKFAHRFTIEKIENRTRVTRTVHFYHCRSTRFDC